MRQTILQADRSKGKNVRTGRNDCAGNRGDNLSHGELAK